MQDEIYIVAGDEMVKLAARMYPERQCVPFREDLSKGNYLRFAIDRDFAEGRAEFWGVEIDDYQEKIAPIVQLDMNKQYVLNFGEDDCCQANLRFVIGYLKNKGYARDIRVQIVDEYDLTILKEYTVPAHADNNDYVI